MLIFLAAPAAGNFFPSFEISRVFNDRVLTNLKSHTNHIYGSQNRLLNTSPLSSQNQVLKSQEEKHKGGPLLRADLSSQNREKNVKMT